MIIFKLISVELKKILESRCSKFYFKGAKQNIKKLFYIYIYIYFGASSEIYLNPWVPSGATLIGIHIYSMNKLLIKTNIENYYF